MIRFALLFLLLFSSSFSYAQVDYTGFFRFRAVSHYPSFFPPISQQTLKLQGRIRPHQTLQTDFWLFSSSELNNQDLDNFRFYTKASFFISDNFSLHLGYSPVQNLIPTLFSQNDYHPYPIDFRGAELKYKTERLSLELWLGYFDQYSAGMHGDLEMISSLLKRVRWQAVLLQDSFMDNPSKTSRFGLGIEGQIPLFHLNYVAVGAAHTSGFQFRAEETMYDVTLSYLLADFLESELLFGYHKDSPGYQPWFYDRHKMSGLLDILAWGNLKYFSSRYSFKIPRLLDFAIHGYYMLPGQPGSLDLDFQGQAFFEKESLKVSKDHRGLELDLEAGTSFSENWDVKLLTGVFSLVEPGDKIFSFKKPYIHLQLTSLYKF